MVGGYSKVNYTTDDQGKLLLLVNSQIDELKVDGLRNKLRK